MLYFSSKARTSKKRGHKTASATNSRMSLRMRRHSWPRLRHQPPPLRRSTRHPTSSPHRQQPLFRAESTPRYCATSSRMTATPSPGLRSRQSASTRSSSMVCRYPTSKKGPGSISILPRWAPRATPSRGHQRRWCVDGPKRSCNWGSHCVAAPRHCASDSCGLHLGYSAH